MNDSLQSYLKLLPHGPEFRFLHTLISLDPGIQGVAEYTVPPEEPFLRGHFPGAPLFPGVLLVEGAAQLAGVVAQTDPGVTPLAGLKLTAMRAVKITGSALPGETIRYTAKIVHRMGLLVQAEATAEVAGRVMLSAQITLAGT